VDYPGVNGSVTRKWILGRGTDAVTVDQCS